MNYIFTQVAIQLILYIIAMISGGVFLGNSIEHYKKKEYTAFGLDVSFTIGILTWLIKSIIK